MTDDQGELPATGAVDGESVAAVDEILAVLDGLDHVPLLEHGPLFEGVHAGLHSLLAEPER